MAAVLIVTGIIFEILKFNPCYLLTFHIRALLDSKY
jgi:hypothetical protein